MKLFTILRFSIISVLLVFFVSCDSRDKPASRNTSKGNSVNSSKAALDLGAESSYMNDPDLDKQISDVVRCIFQDQRGTFWFGTEGGIYSYNGDTLKLHDVKVKGYGITAKSIVEDRAGNIWFGTSFGVTKFDGTTFSSYTEDDGLCGNDVWCTFVDKSGMLWIGTYDGVCRFDGKTFSPFPLPPTPKKNPNRGVSSTTIVWSITDDRAGNIWFAAEGRVYKYDGNIVSRVPVLDQHSDTWVNRILEDRNGVKWFSTQSCGLLRSKGDTYSSLLKQFGLSQTVVDRVYEDKSGNIWFHAKGMGLYCYDGKSLKLYNQSNGLNLLVIMDIYEDSTNRLWVAGRSGLYRLVDEIFVNVTREGPWH